MSGTSIAPLFLSAVLCANISAADSWSPGWAMRRRLTVGETELGGVRRSVAYASIPTLGQCKPDGSDLRIFGPTGTEVRSHIVWSGSDEHVLVAFEHAAKGAYSAYFGNPSAKPALPWEPGAGLILEVRDLGDGTPSSWEEAQKLLPSSSKVLGRLLWPRLEVNQNPVSSSERGVYIFSGILDFPSDGNYGFQCNAAAASFLLIDGKLAVDFPGWHNAKNPKKDSNQGRIDLKAGPHKLECLIFFNTPGSCLVGWQRPGDRGFTPLPVAAFAGYSVAAIGPAENRSGPVPDFDWEALDDLGMEGRDVTSVRFDALGPGKVFKWDFGDGALSLARSPVHVFLESGTYKVLLEIDGKAVTQRVFVHPSNGPRGKPYEKRIQEYSAILREYLPGNLTAGAAFELGLICHESGRLDAAAAGFRAAYEKGYMPRNAEDERFIFVLYEQYRDSGKYPDALWVCDTIIKNAEKNEALIAQALNLKAEIQYDYMDDLAAAGESCKRVLVDCSRERTDYVRAAYIRLGEYALARGDRAGARKILEEVQNSEKWKKWSGDISVTEGSHELNFTQYLRAGEFEAALQEVRSLEWKNPTVIMTGQTRFFRGRVLLARRQFAAALKDFERAMQADRQAPFADELLYAKAVAYEGLKLADKAADCYRKLLKEFPESSFAVRAKEKLK